MIKDGLESLMFTIPFDDMKGWGENYLMALCEQLADKDKEMDKV